MAAQDHTKSPSQQADQHHALRIVAICSFVPAVALLLPCGIISARPVPAIGIAPMFFSSAFNALTVNGKPRLPKTTLCIHLFLASFLISILVPSWVFMAEGDLSYWGGDGLTMLGAYGTMPMMINFLIHLYLALRTLPLISWYRQSAAVCCCYNPACCARRPDAIKAFAGNGKGDEAHQPMIGFYDEDARPSGEFQTSGFNTPRVSQETLGSEGGKSCELV